MRLSKHLSVRALVSSFLAVAPQVALAFKEGGGVPFGAFGQEGVDAVDLANGVTR